MPTLVFPIETEEIVIFSFISSSTSCVLFLYIKCFHFQELHMTCESKNNCSDLLDDMALIPFANLLCHGFPVFEGVFLYLSVDDMAYIPKSSAALAGYRIFVS